MKVKIAVVSPKSYSFPGTREEHKNVEIAKKYVDEAAEEGAKIICFPEAYPGPFCGSPTYFGAGELCGKARENKVHVIAGGLERGPSGKYYTTAWLINPSGRRVGKYRRTTPAGPPVYENVFGISFDKLIWGNELPVFRTKYGTIGIFFCSEVYTPEISRVLAIKGADIIFAPSGGTPPYAHITWTTLLWARAIENLVYVAYCQHMPEPGGYGGIGGATRILSPESVLSQSPFEGFITATLDMDRLKLLRNIVEDTKPPFRLTQPALSSGLGFYTYNNVQISRKPDLYRPIVMKKSELGK